VTGTRPTRLPSGRHGLPREVVINSQRERLFEAMVAAVAEKGYGAVTVADVISGAGVSRATFYELFGDKEDCFIAAHDELIGRLMEYVTSAFESEEEWPDQTRATIAALLRFLAANPDAARVAMVEVLAAGAQAQERYRLAIRGFVPFLEQGRRYSGRGSELPGSVPRIVVGGIATTLFEEVVAGHAASLTRLLPELTYTALVPYVGHRRALEEMWKTPPQ
jgi:AcrR family transcriptional regulator